MASSARWSIWNFGPFRWYPKSPLTPTLPLPPPLPVPGELPVSTRVIAAMNAERTRRGLPALTEDPVLNVIALDWAEQMARNRRISHGNFTGRIEAAYPNSAAAENVAAGYGSVDEVMTGWMGSAPHRANILGLHFTLVGIGRAVDANGTVYWCGDFDLPAKGPNR